MANILRRPTRFCNDTLSLFLEWESLLDYVCVANAIAPTCRRLQSVDTDAALAGADYVLLYFSAQ